MTRPSLFGSAVRASTGRSGGPSHGAGGASLGRVVASRQGAGDPGGGPRSGDVGNPLTTGPGDRERVARRLGLFPVSFLSALSP
jgi:hypothetical protein